MRHYVEIVVGSSIENVEDLIEHLPVLGRDAKTRQQLRFLCQRLGHRQHFDGLGPGSEDEKDFCATGRSGSGCYEFPAGRLMC